MVGLGDFLSFIESPPIYNINKIRNSKNQAIELKRLLEEKKVFSIIFSSNMFVLLFKITEFKQR